MSPELHVQYDAQRRVANANAAPKFQAKSSCNRLVRRKWSMIVLICRAQDGYLVVQRGESRPLLTFRQRARDQSIEQVFSRTKASGRRSAA